MTQLWELDEFTIGSFLGYVREREVDNSFRGATWLPNQNINDIAFEYARGANRQPVMAHVMAYDSEAPIAGRRGEGSRIVGELPPIKRKAKFTEKDLIRWTTPRQGTDDKELAITSVYDRTDELLYGIQARVEWLRIKALSEKTLDYDEAGVEFSFDYGLDGELILDLATQQNGNGTSIAADVGAAWSDHANSTPLADLLYVQKLWREKLGVNPATLVLSGIAWGHLLSSASLRVLIRGDLAPTAPMTPDEVKNLFAIYGLPAIEVYDSMVTNENADGTTTQQRLLRADRGFFLPPTPVGSTLWGPTAESRALIGTPQANQAPGIVAVTYATVEPPAEWVKAAAVAFPTMPNAHQLGQIELF